MVFGKTRKVEAALVIWTLPLFMHHFFFDSGFSSKYCYNNYYHDYFINILVYTKTVDSVEGVI